MKSYFTVASPMPVENLKGLGHGEVAEELA